MVPSENAMNLMDYKEIKRNKRMEAGKEFIFICGSSSRPLEQICSILIMSLWVEPRALRAC